MTLERLREIDEVRQHMVVRLGQGFRDALANAETNLLDCPEIRHYQRDERGGVVVVTFEVRRPGEAEWQPVKLVRLV